MDLTHLPINAEVAIQTGKTIYRGQVLGYDGDVLVVEAPGAHPTWRIICFHVYGARAGKSLVGDYTLHAPGEQRPAVESAADAILIEERQYRRLVADMERRLEAAATSETGRGIETPPPGQMRLPYSDYEPCDEVG